MTSTPLNEARKRDMTPEELALLEQEFEKRKKKTSTMAILLFLLGGFGAHRFYLGHKGYGAAMLIQTLIFGVATAGISSVIWWIVEVFIVWNVIEKVNHEIETEIIDRILAYRTAKATH